MENIIPITRIQQHAKKAVTHYRTAQEGCPYPAHTGAAHLFSQYFDAEKARRLEALDAPAAPSTLTSTPTP